MDILTLRANSLAEKNSLLNAATRQSLLARNEDDQTVFLFGKQACVSLASNTFE